MFALGECFSAAALAHALLFFGAPPERVAEPSFVFDRWRVPEGAIVDAVDVGRLVAWAPGDSIPNSRLAPAAGTIERALAARGFWDARVALHVANVPANGRAAVDVMIDPGDPATIGSISIAGNRVLAREEILDLLDMREGTRFDAAAIESGCARVLRAYAERGRPLARLSPGRVRRAEDGRVAWTLGVGEGPETSLEELRLLGKSSTSPAVVARIAGVRPGGVWDARRIDEIAARLRREEIFSYVGEPRVVRGTRDNRLAVELQVEERKTSSILGVLGYVPSPEGGGEIAGLVDLRLGNILGTARRASLHVERQTRDVRDLAFRYREPWLLGTPVSVEVGASQTLRDSTFTRTDLDVALGVPLGARTRASLSAERRDSSIDGPVGVDLDETSTGGSFALFMDRRDRRLDPSRGVEASARVGLRRTESDVTRTRLELGASGHLPVGGRWGLAEGAAFRGVWTSEGDVPISDQYFFGGTNSLRGYREEQFRGTRVWWTRTELRYRLANRSRGYAFADVGGFERVDRDALGNARSADDVLPGWGVGLAVMTRGAGMLHVELALGRGDGFSDAKVHAGLEQEF